MGLSRFCRIRFPTTFGPDPAGRGLLLEGTLLPWAAFRAVGYLTWVVHAGVDPDHVVVQSRDGMHYWFDVSCHSQEDCD